MRCIAVDNYPTHGYHDDVTDVSEEVSVIDIPAHYIFVSVVLSPE